MLVRVLSEHELITQGAGKTQSDRISLSTSKCVFEARWYLVYVNGGRVRITEDRVQQLRSLKRLETIFED